MILEMTLPQPAIAPADPLANVRRLLGILATDGWYIEVTQRAFIRNIYQPLYGHLVPVADVSFMLSRGYITTDSQHPYRARFTITEAGKAVTDG